MPAESRSQRGPLLRPRCGKLAKVIAHSRVAVTLLIKTVHSLSEEVAVEIGLDIGVGWLDQLQKLVAEVDISLARFAAGLKPRQKICAGRTCLRAFDDAPE